jgi:tetratricopeptide (TPR) repeat protein
MREELASDFPAALGSLDESDLPVISAGLPAAKPAVAPRAPPRPAPSRTATDRSDPDLPIVAADLPTAKPAPQKPSPIFDLDLPVPAADLPSARREGEGVGLPQVAADLPSPAAALPAIAAGLPSPAAALPVPAAALPQRAAGLPIPASDTRGFGEIDLPAATDALPAVPALDHHLPVRRRSSGEIPSVGFGEIDLPHESGPSTSPVPSGPSGGPKSVSADFGDLQLDDKPRSASADRGVAVRTGSRPGASSGETNRASGRPGYGEVDLGGGSSADSASGIGVETSRDGLRDAPDGMELPEGAVEPKPISLRPAGRRERPPVRIRSRAIGKAAAIGVVVLAFLGGAALQLTPYGAYGYLYGEDLLRGPEYERAAVAAIGDVEKAVGSDTYEAAKVGVDAAFAARARTPRAKPLTAYAAFVEYATSVRFGPDTTRAPRAKQSIAELPVHEPVRYLDEALAAQAADGGDLEKARRALDAATKRDPNDPIQVEVALLRGNVELAARDGAASLLAFGRALALANDARAHFGLARAQDLLGNAAKATQEIEATLVASPQHPGAFTLRAKIERAAGDEAQARLDLASVLDGAARPKASPSELSDAYATKAWLSLERGGSSEASDAFEQAVKLNPRNVEALNGEGRLLLNEGRYTEALARIDTALQFDPYSPETIANDAQAKIGLERLADAKQQLVTARARFPENLSILVALGGVEQHLGNNDAAESALRAAIGFAVPSRSDAVLPYVALSELQASRGRLGDARATLDDAKKRLPPSAALERALGEVSELQGDYDAAIGHYRAALAKDPRDAAGHFHLGVALRRIRRLPEAAAELDKVAAVDKDYPGLSLERGLLFEDSGDVEKAIDEFKGALAKAPDDPDLQLRVGSAYVAIGRPDDALPMLRKVLDKRPTSAEAHHYLGRALMLKAGSSQPEALRYLKRAVELDANRAEFHVYLAWAANDATPAQLELARDEIDKALALDKLSPEAYWQRGVLERMEGAIEDAIRDEKHALELRPSRYEAHATLAECYEDKNDDGAAAAEWARAIAGDGNATGPDASVPHPYWRYRYGKLLMEHGGAPAALAQLLPAATTAEKLEVRPGWVAPLEFLVADALRKAGHKAAAIEHYKRFLDIAPVTSPDRADAQRALGQLTGAH